MEHGIFDLGDFELQKGSLLPDAKLGYMTLGKLNKNSDNAIVCPTWFSSTPADVAKWMTGSHRALNPEKYFIIIPNHFGAGVSSSPSNTPEPFGRSRFPKVTYYDNVEAQHRLVTEVFGIERLRLVSSWSMGAAQTYAWAALYPEMVPAAAPISGSARTSNYNWVFLESLRRAITSDPDWNDGFYTDKPPIKGLRTVSAIYAGWGVSEPFYRKELFREFGASTPEQFIEYFWEGLYLPPDANNLLTQIWTWMNGDLGDHPRFGDFDVALRAIQARTIILNSETDQYFPPVDSEYEAARIPHGEARPIPSIWGHFAPYNPEDQQFIDRALEELLATTAEL